MCVCVVVVLLLFECLDSVFVCVWCMVACVSLP